MKTSRTLIVPVTLRRPGIVRRALPLLGLLILAAMPMWGSNYTFTGPAGGALNTASTNFTVAPSANYTGVITIALSGGGLTGTSKMLTFSNSKTAQTFTITPTAAGQVTLTTSANPAFGSTITRHYNTPPGAPSNVTARPGNGVILVTFTAGVNGGAAITYTVTCGLNSQSSSSTVLVMSGLTNGTAYTCTATATNTYGTSAASSASASATPMAGLGPTPASAVFGEPDFVTKSGGTSSTLLSGPDGVALDASGNLYVADSGNNRVLYIPAGSTTATVVYGQPNLTSKSTGTSSTQLNAPIGVAVDAGGGVYVADTGNNRVVYFPAGSAAAPPATATVVYGEPDFTSSSGGTSSTLLNAPFGVATDASGGVYVADDYNSRALYFPAGSTTATAVYGEPDFTSGSGGTSSTKLNSPIGVATDAGGGLYVADYANNRVLYFAAGSTTATVVYGQPNLTSNSPGTSATMMDHPVGVAVDASGGLYVAEVTNNRVLYFPAGSTTATGVYGQWDFTSSIAALSAVTLSGPFRVALDGKGNLYVADSGNNRVVEFPINNAVAANLSITATHSSPIFQSGLGTFTLTVTNSGGTTAGAATVSDTIDSAFTINSFSTGCSAMAQIVTCMIASGSSAATTTFNIYVTASSSAASSVANPVTLSDSSDTITSGSSTDTIAVTAQAPLADTSLSQISISGSTDNSGSCGTGTHTLTASVVLKNNGSTLTNPYPANITLTQSDTLITASPGGTGWANGANLTFTFHVTLVTCNTFQLSFDVRSN